MLFLVSLAALTAEGCALHVNGRTQPVMIVTDPPGAEVIYDRDSWRRRSEATSPR